jgi:hypothetical protein
MQTKRINGFGDYMIDDRGTPIRSGSMRSVSKWGLGDRWGAGRKARKSWRNWPRSMCVLLSWGLQSLCQV